MGDGAREGTGTGERMGERTRQRARTQEVKLMISVLTIFVRKCDVDTETDRSFSNLDQDREAEIGTGVSEVAE